MINQTDIENIKSVAKEFDVKKIWLFGSSLKDDITANDIDLAVEGVPEGKFFKFYAKLMMLFPKPVDLVDLSSDSPIVKIIRETGKIVYG